MAHGQWTIGNQAQLKRLLCSGIYVQRAAIRKPLKPPETGSQSSYTSPSPVLRTRDLHKSLPQDRPAPQSVAHLLARLRARGAKIVAAPRCIWACLLRLHQPGWHRKRHAFGNGRYPLHPHWSLWGRRGILRRQVFQPRVSQGLERIRWWNGRSVCMLRVVCCGNLLHSGILGGAYNLLVDCY